MWTYIKDSFSEGIEDLGYNAKRMGALFFGKQMAHEVPQLLPQVLGGLSGVASGVLSNLASLIVIPSIMAVSAGVVQSDHLHRRRLLKDEYSEEIAKAIGKSAQAVTEADMERLARGDLKAGIRANAVLREALDQSRVERNASIVASGIASVGAYSFVHWFEHAVGTEGAISAIKAGIEAGSVEGVATGIGLMALNALVGLASYFVIKTPLHAYGGKLLGLEKETAQDRIHDIRWARDHGKTITPEMVFAVHLHAKPELGAQIKESYGKEFRKLPAITRTQIVAMMDQDLRLAEAAEAITRGEKKPEELAFEVLGQHSGVVPHAEQVKKVEEAKPGMLGQLWEKLAALKEKSVDAPAAQMQEFLPGETKIAVYAPDAETAAIRVDNHYEAPGVMKNFVASVGRTGNNEGMSHVERYQSSSKWVIER